MRWNKGVLATALLVACAVVMGPAMAQADTTAAVSGFTAVGTAVAAVGGAMLTAAAAGIVYKWVVAFIL
jgi:hypothetical protein